ncbi:FG-GAP repeat domain-containing protein, partial [Streptomyces sp. NPDC057494]|uniref:FG-GAP repeat domain-containing protein n=1 Tax=Streptomyces sp. NPDC057494 TaxID=3346148 RepID=UPI0036B8A9D8
ESTGKLWLYPGTGSGLNARIEIGTGGWNSLHDLTDGDFNGDHKDDIIGVEESTGKLWLYPGTGSGLNARIEIGTGGWNSLHDLVGMDLNNDGKSDIVAVETSSSKLWWYKGNGTGLETRTEIGSGGWNSMHDLAGGDFMPSKDGDLPGDDLVGIETSSSKPYLYPGRGTGLTARMQIGTAGW